MSGGQIDKLYADWLRQNYGEKIASKYRPHSLTIPMWNTPDINDALETLIQALCMGFGPSESFGTTDYHEARRKLGLPVETPVPEVFIEAFAESREGS